MFLGVFNYIVNVKWMKGEHLWMNFVHDYINDNVGDDVNNDVEHDSGNDIKYNVGLDVGYFIHDITSPSNKFHKEWPWVCLGIDNGIFSFFL